MQTLQNVLNHLDVISEDNIPVADVRDKLLTEIFNTLHADLKIAQTEVRKIEKEIQQLRPYIRLECNSKWSKNPAVKSFQSKI